MRHLFVAMIQEGAVTDLVRQTFKYEISDSDLLDLKEVLVDRIMTTPFSGETREAWLECLQLPDKSESPRPRATSGAIGTRQQRAAHRRGATLMAFRVSAVTSQPAAQRTFWKPRPMCVRWRA
jgi:hypothetical protein